MELLLDTHALFWVAYKPERLSSAATSALSDGSNATWATLASAHEISLKLGVGKWKVALHLMLNFDAAVVGAGLNLLAPTATDYANVLRLPDVPEHRDPFDRLIIAQALARGMVLVSSDPFAPRYGVQTIVAGQGERVQEARSGRVVPAQPLTSVQLPER